jgi:hypothetical protein
VIFVPVSCEHVDNFQFHSGLTSSQSHVTERGLSRPNNSAAKKDMNTSATVKYIYVTGWEVRTENISARDRRSGDASETEGKYFSRQKVFPCTEISLVDRRDLGDRDNVFPISHINTTFPLSGITFCRVNDFSIQLMFSATSQLTCDQALFYK